MRGLRWELIERFEDHCAGAAGAPEILLWAALVFGRETGVGEGGEDVLRVRAGDAVEVEVGRIELGAKLGAFGVLPDVNAVAARAFEFTRLGKGQHVLGRAGEFQHALADPAFERFPLRPRGLVGVGVWRERDGGRPGGFSFWMKSVMMVFA